MQRIEIPEVTYSSDDLRATARSDAEALGPDPSGANDNRRATAHHHHDLSGDFTAAYPNEWVEPGQMVTLRDAGRLTFVLDSSQGEVEIVRGDTAD